MQSKIILKRKLWVIVFTGFIALSPVFLFSLISGTSFNHGVTSSVENIFYFFKQKQVIPPEQTDSDLSAGEIGKPAHLIIPKINVDSTVEHVGLTSNGAMDVPKERANVAWFELGQRPGENGSAVIAGHYGRENGKGSVFDDLHKLHKGDRVYVKDDEGTTISFVVRESRRYDPKADASGVFSSNDGQVHLNFVTCEGVWDEKTQQYSKRLVVFTDKEVE